MSDKQFTNVRAAETEVEKKSGKDSCHLGVWHWALIVIVILVCAGLGIGLGVYFGVFADQSVHVSPGIYFYRFDFFNNPALLNL